MGPRAPDLGELLRAAATLGAQAPRVERHLWFIGLGRWLTAGDDPVPRLAMLLQRLKAEPPLAAAVVARLHEIWRDGDAAALFADLGFAPRRGFTPELLDRMLARVLPATPDTDDLAELFALAFGDGADAAWLQRVDDAALRDWAALLAGGDAAAWRGPLLDALTWLASAIRAAGFSPRLRRRMDPALWAQRPFDLLAGAVQQFRAAQEGAETDTGADTALTSANLLRALLARCDAAARSVMDHLEAHGVSLDLVFEVEQMVGRIHRAETVMRVLLAPPGSAPAAREAAHLIADLGRAAQTRHSVRAHVSQHTSLLARKVAERSAETGEHYITRNAAEYRTMLRQAAGGGLVIIGTTFMKFAVMALGLGAFWAGFWAGANYALSFLLIHLLHWTVATKQPAMTGPALAARLAAPGGRSDAEGFAEEVAHLVRSQIAGIVGNLGVVAPGVLAVQWLATRVRGEPLVGTAQAEYVLHGLTLLGPTALFAAFTGLLLFASSQIAGWAENAFVYRRLDSAIAHHPAMRSLLGAERAAHWAQVARRQVSGVTANVSLGLMLGLVPAVLGFLGLPLDVRHVTLSTGQLAAAAGALGPALLSQPAFWWCVAGIVVTGVLNVGVSFYCAFRVALRARDVPGDQRALLRQALWRRLRERPKDFLRPPPDAPAGHAAS